MNEKIEKLNALDENKLIDVVKNYRQYGYNEELRNAAIEILESRGVNMESLKFQGNFDNKSYDSAKDYYNSFEKSSKIAFILYGFLVFIKLIFPLIVKSAESIQIIIGVISWISLIGFIVFLIKSYVSQSKYYELIGQKESELNPLLYFTLGAFLYLIMFFVFRKQMKEDINLIR